MDLNFDKYELNTGIGISLAVMHDYTHYEDDIPRNDIMMLKLDKMLEPTNNINFACLPQSRFDTPRPGDKCTIAGWGVNSKSKNIKSRIRKLSLFFEKIYLHIHISILYRPNIYHR
jgi:hypothetical protein